MGKPKCQSCKRRTAVWRIRNAYTTEANGKLVCRDANCFAQQTLGYPAEGRSI